jgi:hypothetical protein
VSSPGGKDLINRGEKTLLAVHVEIDLKWFEGVLYTDQYRK